jgi:hypothetical protein
MTNVKSKIRYDFEWEVRANGDIVATVTRNEWPCGFSVLGYPISVNKVKIEITNCYFRFLPVPPDKTFHPFPEDEKEHVMTIAKAYRAAVRAEKVFTYWESI